MTGALSGRAAVILGADAIGAGIARRFLREGARVAVIAAEDIHTDDVPGSIHRAVEAAVERLGALHILVNNALPPPAIAALEDQGSAAFATALGAVTAMHAAMRAAFPHLRASGAGRIINVGHRYGEGANEAIGPYNAAAWALIGLTRTAAVDWGRYQIVTNLLMPLADTPEYRGYHARKPAILDLMESQIPLGRMGDPVEDVGGAAVFLASDAAAFVNGEVIHGDGGQHTAGPVLNPGKFAQTAARQEPP
ncbi:MAG: SDR family NAD(P)-dependent oxidoreductase [Steroidobacteraceae bacterium]